MKCSNYHDISQLKSELESLTQNVQENFRLYSLVYSISRLKMIKRGKDIG